MQGNAAAPAGLTHGLCVELAQQEMQARDGRGMRQRVGHAEDRFAHGFGIGNRAEGDWLDLLAANVDDSDIDTVERGAAHDAGYTHTNSRKRTRMNANVNSLVPFEALPGVGG